MTEEKILENRLRRIADRRGLRLMKSRARDPLSLTFGGYQLVDIGDGGLVCGHTAIGRGYGASLADIEKYLGGGEVQPSQTLRVAAEGMRKHFGIAPKKANKK